VAASPTSAALPRRASSPRATTSASIGYHAKKLRHTLTPAVRPAAGSPSPPFKRSQCRVAGSATTPSNCATASRRQGARRHDHHHRPPSSAPSGRRAAVRAQGPLAHRQLQPQQPPHPLPGEGRRHQWLSGNALGYWLARNFVPCHMLLQY
jgi:hypothetical protein